MTTNSCVLVLIYFFKYIIFNRYVHQKKVCWQISHKHYNKDGESKACNILTWWKQLYDHIVLLKRKVWDRNTSLHPPPFYWRVCVKPKRWAIVYMCVGVSIFSIWIWICLFVCFVCVFIYCLPDRNGICWSSSTSSVLYTIVVANLLYFIFVILLLLKGR